MRWVPHVLALELKKAFAYRVNFWIQFVLSTCAEVGVAYFLWQAVFAARGVNELEGFTFHGIVFYFLLATSAIRIARGADRGHISEEIYDGSLTRYLLYPVPLFAYKYVTHLGQQILHSAQFLIAICFFHFFIGIPGEANFTMLSLLAGLGTCLLAGLLHFCIALCLDMVAFWQDVIWSLFVMLKFGVSLLGGAMVPLAFFPEWGQRVAQLTPFPALVTFPTRTLLGQLTLLEWLQYAGILVAWSFFFAGVAAFFWKRGLKQYTGVGV